VVAVAEGGGMIGWIIFAYGFVDVGSSAGLWLANLWSTSDRLRTILMMNKEKSTLKAKRYI